MKTGDLIAYQGHGVTSSMIKMVTKAPYTHVGVVVTTDDNSKDKKHLFTYESTGNHWTNGNITDTLFY